MSKWMWDMQKRGCWVIHLKYNLVTAGKSVQYLKNSSSLIKRSKPENHCNQGLLKMNWILRIKQCDTCTQSYNNNYVVKPQASVHVVCTQ